MNIWKKFKESIHPEDDEGPFDDEFDDDYPGTGMGMNNGMGSMGSDNMGDFGGSYSASGNPYGNSSQNLNNSSTQPQQNNQYQQQTPTSQSTPVSSSISVSGSGDMREPVEIRIIKPENFDSVARIAELLISRKTIMLNLEETNKELGRRLLDFLKGVCFAIGGDVKKGAEKSWILTPSNVTISIDNIRSEENSDRRDNNDY